jgi:hypothetical protein
MTEENLKKEEGFEEGLNLEIKFRNECIPSVCAFFSLFVYRTLKKYSNSGPKGMPLKVKTCQLSNPFS